MIGRRVDVYHGTEKVAEVRTPAMAFALLSMLVKHPVRVLCQGRVIYNSATDGHVADINAYAHIVAPRFNVARSGSASAAMDRLLLRESEEAIQ